ncbi:inverse autotransporter beta domain-containing protein [Vibrio paucivorans]
MSNNNNNHYCRRNKRTWLGSNTLNATWNVFNLNKLVVFLFLIATTNKGFGELHANELPNLGSDIELTDSTSVDLSPHIAGLSESIVEKESDEWAKSQLKQYIKNKDEELVSSIDPKTYWDKSSLEIDFSLYDNLFENDGDYSGSIGFVGPLYDNEKEAYLLQISYQLNGSGQFMGRDFFNLGLGYRLSSGEYVYGVNAFFDHDVDRKHNRASVGAELFSTYIDLSSNYYFPLSDWKSSPDKAFYLERAAQGVDLFVKGYLPSYPALSTTLGAAMYFGDEVDPLGQGVFVKDPYEYSIELGYRPSSLLSFDVKYNDAKGSNSEFSLSSNLTYQFGQSLPNQLKALAPESVLDLDLRRYDFVKRNNNIVLEYKFDPRLAVVNAHTLAVQPLNYPSFEPIELVVDINGRTYSASEIPDRYSVQWDLSASPELLATSSSSRSLSAQVGGSVVVPPFDVKGKGFSYQVTITDKETKNVITTGGVVKVEANDGLFDGIGLEPNDGNVIAPQKVVQFAVLFKTNDSEKQPLVDALNSYYEAYLSRDNIEAMLDITAPDSQYKFRNKTWPNVLEIQLSQLDAQPNGRVEIPYLDSIANNLSPVAFSSRGVMTQVLATKVFDFRVGPENLDRDGDGLKDSEEYAHGTDVNLVDTDGDLMSDREELENGTDPLNNREHSTILVNGNFSYQVRENEAVTTEALTVTDNLGPITWSVRDEDGANANLIDTESGRITFSPADFESPTDANQDNKYEIRATVTDTNANQTTKTILVEVLDVLELIQHSIKLLNPVVKVNENSGDVKVADATVLGNAIGGNNNLSWSLEGEDEQYFTLNGQSLYLSNQDFENRRDNNNSNDYQVTVVAEDRDGNRDSESLTVKIENVSESATHDVTLKDLNTAIPENSGAVKVAGVELTGTAIGGETWSLSGADASHFELRSGGSELFMKSQDFELPKDLGSNNTYSVDVVATDADGNIKLQPLTVTVTNVVETATHDVSLTNKVTAVPENSGTVKVAGVELTGSAIGGVTWGLAGDDSAHFSWSNGHSALMLRTQDFESPADQDRQNSYEVTVVATDAEGNTKEQSLTVNITDVYELPRPRISGAKWSCQGTCSNSSASEIAYEFTVDEHASSITWIEVKVHIHQTVPDQNIRHMYYISNQTYTGRLNLNYSLKRTPYLKVTLKNGEAYMVNLSQVNSL